MSFATLGLSQQLLHNLKTVGFSQSTPIQKEAIPMLLKGDELIAAAPTGTGKTAAFALPILQTLQPAQQNYRHIQALVVVPTRELAIQVGESFTALGQGMDYTMLTLLGGVKVEQHKKALQAGADVVVVTPGRLIELLDAKVIVLSKVRQLVLDEADTMLDMGFINDVYRIIEAVPEDAQMMMFSAAYTASVKRLGDAILKRAKHLDLSEKAGAKTVNQRAIRVDREQKEALLAYLIGSNNWNQVLVFTRTKEGADALVKELALDGIKAAALHGDKSQGSRTKALAGFKEGTIPVLIATDIAARGIDINGLPYVVNYELPHKPQEYIHRIGRTGRAGREGEAISLVTAQEYKHLLDIERVLGKKLQRETVEGFEPTEKAKAPSKHGQGIAKTKEKIAGAFGAKKPKGPKQKKLRGKRAIYAPLEEKPSALGKSGKNRSGKRGK